MNEQKGSKGDAKALGILAFMVAVGAMIFLESSGLQYAKPRSLSTTPIALSQLPRNPSIEASIQTDFMEPIGCELPLPQKADVGASNGTCVRFFPDRFIKGVASPFQHQYEHSKQVKTEHPVVHMTLRNESSSTYPTSMTYLHIRKCGGTTMFRSLSSRSIQLPYTVNKYNRMMIDKMGIVRDIYYEQKRAGRDNNPVAFSFVRDPVVRFLSSVGQMLHMGKVKLFQQCDDQTDLLREISIHESNTTIAKSQALVQCMLQSIKSNTEEALAPDFDYIDQHMLPQAFELRARSLEYDIEIHLMSMGEISSTLRTLAGVNKQNKHARSSRVADYTQGYFLETSILTQEIVRDICHIYAVDVLLLKQTGIATTLCDTFTTQQH